MIPAGNEELRTFMPTRDFETSKRFYETLGFDKIVDGEVAIFKTGAGAFILQRFYVKEWADNFVMSLVVDDLNGWWEHIESLDLAGKFGVRAPTAPAMQPWGLKVAYVVDPAGVLWHFAQRPD